MFFGVDLPINVLVLGKEMLFERKMLCRVGDEPCECRVDDLFAFPLHKILVHAIEQIDDKLVLRID